MSPQVAADGREGIIALLLGTAILKRWPESSEWVIGTFIGILWVTAISEEFIFRGLLQPWLERWTASPIAALIITSLLFGSVHLGFHGPFPNWRFSICAAILGLRILEETHAFGASLERVELLAASAWVLAAAALGAATASPMRPRLSMARA